MSIKDRFERRRQKREREHRVRVRPRRRYRLGPLGAGGGAILFVVGAWYTFNGYRTLDWPSVEGTVVTSEVVRKSSSLTSSRHRSRYEPVVTYRYTIDGREYTSDTLSASDDSSSRAYAQSACRKYPPGSEVIVYYNPKHLTDTVLERGISPFSYILMAMGLGGIGWGLFKLLRERAQQARLAEDDAGPDERE